MTRLEIVAHNLWTTAQAGRAALASGDRRLVEDSLRHLGVIAVNARNEAAERCALSTHDSLVRALPPPLH
ncbi:MAG TPA: hypothetical protein VEB20_10405 [Azospirillaceae bacterium]|nr:hypothetical protein [Azospirillaceae bacterium]